MTHIPHWEYQHHTARDDSGGIAEYDPAAECPFKVTSMRQMTPGVPALTDCVAAVARRRSACRVPIGTSGCMGSGRIDSATSASRSGSGNSNASQIAASSSLDASLRPRSTSDRYPRLTRAWCDTSRRVRRRVVRAWRRLPPMASRSSRVIGRTSLARVGELRLCRFTFS